MITLVLRRKKKILETQWPRFRMYTINSSQSNWIVAERSASIIEWNVQCTGRLRWQQERNLTHQTHSDSSIQTLMKRMHSNAIPKASVIHKRMASKCQLYAQT